MIFNYGRSAMLGLAVAVVLTLTIAAHADPGDSPEVEAQRLVHILGYTAGDYAGAVANGEIVSASEYAEQLALTSEASKIAAALPPTARATDLAAQVDRVRALVARKAPEAEVVATVVEVRGLVTAAFKLPEAPTAPPDLARGHALYTEHCATCHGDDGRADTDRARSLEPHPANFHDPKVSDPLTPLRASSTVRFGINGTAMVPFTFLTDADRWALAFYATGLRHVAPPASDAPTYSLAELSVRSDEDLRRELRAAGFAEDALPGLLSDLRRRAPYEDRAGKSPLALARTRLDRARVLALQGDLRGARANAIDAYLEGIEPVEGALRASDPSLVTSIEDRFVALRGRLEANDGDIAGAVTELLADVTRAERLLVRGAEQQSFASVALASGGILVREGVEAALLIAALLGIASKAGLGDRKRWVHAGWMTALALGMVTWVVSAKLIAISGARRELVEGATALLASVVLFYVSYSLLAKNEVARWMRFLRAQVTPRRAALSLFGVAFLAAYREAFETVLFYQPLLASSASSGSTTAAVAGICGGALVLAAVIGVYSRAGKFAPPQLFFKVSSYLLYLMAIVFAGEGVAALQLTGTLPIHRIAVPTVSALGLHGTVEGCAAQGILLALAAYAFIRNRTAEPSRASAPKPAATST